MLKDFMIFLNEEIDKNKDNVIISTVLSRLLDEIIDNLKPSFTNSDAYKICCKHRDEYINLVLSKVDMENDIYYGAPCFELAARYLEQFVSKLERGFLLDSEY